MKGINQMATVEQPTAKSITVIKGQITKASNIGTALEIKNDDDVQVGVEALTIIKKSAKLIKIEKNKFLDPIKALQKQTTEFFKPVEEQLKSAEISIKGKLSKYEMEKQDRIDEEERLLAERMKKEEMKPSDVVQSMSQITEQPTAPIRSKKGGTTSYRIVYVATITERNLVPNEYYVMDESRVKREAIDAYKNGGRPVPGVTIKEEKDVTVRI